MVWPWYEVECAATPNAIPVLWNPEKRLAKVLCDCWAAIQHFMNQEGYAPDLLPLSGAYILLLSIAMRNKPGLGARSRQFALVRSTGFLDRTIEPLMVSQFHDLEAPTPASMEETIAFAS